MAQAAAAGLDPLEAWSRTVPECMEYVEAYRARLRTQAFLLYNQAAAISAFCFSDRKPKPWEVFPGVIPEEDDRMSDDEIAANCLAWCR